MIDEKTPEQIFTVIKDQSETGAPVTSDKNVLNVINYVDENGKTVKTDQVTGQDGDSITLSAPDGYHFVGQTPVLKINSSTPVQVVEVVADTPINNDTKPTKPIEQPSASDDEQKSAAGEVAVSTSPMASKGSSVVTTKTDNQSKQLPQTGDQSNVALVGIGAASLLGMFGLAGLARKRNE
ncbi:MAG TPA: LPXTG cell wall anchor domain-containing protein [Candidatus Limosilactobacillus excrementigallinarum]|nr:LPXTG cell wall anchor domain-containing protein [Candidatus Limosilactobacillus excrementigallinarum]